MAHAHDASENNPVKEVFHALAGIVLLLVIIGGIAVSAWLRPAGNHEPATISATPAGRALDELAQQQAKPTEQSAEATAEATSSEENTAEAEATTADVQPAQADEATAEQDKETATDEKPAQ